MIPFCDLTFRANKQHNLGNTLRGKPASVCIFHNPCPPPNPAVLMALVAAFQAQAPAACVIAHLRPVTGSAARCCRTALPGGEPRHEIFTRTGARALLRSLGPVARKSLQKLTALTSGRRSALHRFFCSPVLSTHGARTHGSLDPATESPAWYCRAGANGPAKQIPSVSYGVLGLIRHDKQSRSPSCWRAAMHGRAESCVHENVETTPPAYPFHQLVRVCCQ